MVCVAGLARESAIGARYRNREAPPELGTDASGGDFLRVLRAEQGRQFVKRAPLRAFVQEPRKRTSLDAAWLGRGGRVLGSVSLFGL